VEVMPEHPTDLNHQDRVTHASNQPISQNKRMDLGHSAEKVARRPYFGRQVNTMPTGGGRLGKGSIWRMYNYFGIECNGRTTQGAVTAIDQCAGSRTMIVLGNRYIAMRGFVAFMAMHCRERSMMIGVIGRCHGVRKYHRLYHHRDDQQ